MVQKILLRRGNKSDVPALDQGEPGVAMNTKELIIGTPDGNFNLSNRNHIFMPINYGDKAAGINHFIQIGGTGTLTYDAAAPSATGVGAYRITGNGIWIMDEIYASCPLSGIGGHIAFYSPSGSANVSAGAQHFEDDQTTQIGTAQQINFISNGVATTGSYELRKNFLHNEGAGVNEFPADARWLIPRIEVGSNTGDVLIDCFNIVPLGFALQALYT